MSSPSATANALAILSAARLPLWQQQTAGATASEYDRPPTESSGTPTAGVSASLIASDSKGTLKARVAIDMRREAYRRRIDITVTPDAATTYTLTVNGTGITGATGADADAILVDLAANVTADATVGGAAGAAQKVEAVLLDSAGAVTVGTAGGGNAAATCVIYGVVNSANLLGDFYFDIGEAGGAGEAVVVADAASATYVAWRATLAAVASAGTVVTPGGWRRWGDALGAGVVTLRGFDAQWPVAGCSRLYLELPTVAGHASDGSGTGNVTITYRIGGIWVGPAILETEQS
jgi:hypothetical protein